MGGNHKLIFNNEDNPTFDNTGKIQNVVLEINKSMNKSIIKVNNGEISNNTANINARTRIVDVNHTKISNLIMNVNTELSSSIVNTNNGTLENILVQGESIGSFSGGSIIVTTNGVQGVINRVYIQANGLKGTNNTSGIAHTNNGSINDSIVSFNNNDGVSILKSVFAHTGTGTINRSAFIGGKAKTLIGDANSTLRIFDSYVNGGSIEAVSEKNKI